MSLTGKQAWAIAHLVAELRPEWEPNGVAAALKRVSDRNPFVVALAAVRAAQDPDAKTPGVIPTDGTHWSEGLKRDPDSGRPPRKGEECAKHAGQWANNCHGCASDRLAGTTTLPPNLRRPDSTDHLSRLRAELQSVKARLCGHGIDRARGRCNDCDTPTPARTRDADEIEEPDRA